MKHADHLRHAQMPDIARLNELITTSARGLSGGYYMARQIDALISDLFGVDTQLIEDETYYLIERGPEFLACGGWSHRRTLFGGDQAKEASDPELDPRTEAARIRAFFVHPAAARQGLGQRLLAHCESEALRAGFHRAELMATLPGEPFYRAAGYEPLERVSHAMRSGESASFVRMGRVLAP